MSSKIKVMFGDYHQLFLSENKYDIILIEIIAFKNLLINYFSLGHQVSPPKPQLD